MAAGLLRGAGRDPGTQRFSWLILEKSPPQSQEHHARVLEIRRREKAKRRIMVCEATGYRTVTVLKRHRALFGALDELVPGAVCQLSEEGLVTKGDGDRLTDPEAFQTLREL